MDFKAKGVTGIQSAIQFAANTPGLEVTLSTSSGSYSGTIADIDNSLIILKSKHQIQADYEKYTYSFVSPGSVTGISFELKEKVTHK